jgi:phenazine biosynthesis-like protein
VPSDLADALGVPPVEMLLNSFNYMTLLESAQVLRALAPDMAAIRRLERSGVIVTAPGDDGYDFVSRYFAPAKGIPEDPVTGAAHLDQFSSPSEETSDTFTHLPKIGAEKWDQLPVHFCSAGCGQVYPLQLR